LSDVATAIKDFAPAVAWVVAAMGWLVANSQANKREVRKEVRGEIDEISKLGKEILSELKKYYKTSVTSDESQQTEMVIKAHFKELDLRFDRLHCRQLSAFPSGGTVPANDAREKFFDLATFKHFETSSRPTGVELSTLVLRQTHANLVLTEALHTQFLQEFR